MQELKCIQEVEWWLDRADFYDESGPSYPTFPLLSLSCIFVHAIAWAYQTCRLSFVCVFVYLCVCVCVCVCDLCVRVFKRKRTFLWVSSVRVMPSCTYLRLHVHA